MIYNVSIGNKKFDIVPVTTFADLKTGLSGLEKLGDNKGMLFVFDKEQEVTMNMENMKFPIDMLFLDKNLRVKRVVPMKLGEEPVTMNNTSYVLEINRGQGYGLAGKKLIISDELKSFLEETKSEDNNYRDTDKAMVIGNTSNMAEEIGAVYKSGGVIDIIEKDVKADATKMQVLDDKGTVLMNIQGGERIFSIKHTEQLVEMAKKVEAGEATEEELGELLAKIVKIHNTQKPQYTT